MIESNEQIASELCSFITIPEHFLEKSRKMIRFEKSLFEALKRFRLTRMYCVNRNIYFL